MKNLNSKIVISIIMAFVLTNTCIAQEKILSKSLDDYGPSAEHTYGRPNPNAPAETKQFEFMIGEFDRTDSLLNRQTGEWQISKHGQWNARYVMNGYAIQDESWNVKRQISTSNARFYDVKKKKWVITWFQMPSYTSSVAEGEKEGDDIVIKSQFNGPHGKVDVEYRFYNITEQSFKWVGQALVNGQTFPFWKISCTRKN